MHENRETSKMSRSHKGRDRSAKAKSRTADMHVLEESDCAVLPVNQPNKEDNHSAEVGEGRAWTKESIVPSYTCPTQRGERVFQRLDGVRRFTSPPIIRGRSRMRKRARTDLCGGRSVMVVPTATSVGINRHVVGDERALQERRVANPS